MRRLLSPIGVGLLLLLAACGGEQTVEPVAVVPSSTSGSSVAETATPVSSVQRTDPSPPVEQATETSKDLKQPTGGPDAGPSALRVLSPSAAAAIDGVDYRVGVAVLDLGSGGLYVGGDEGRFALASVSKLAIALGELHRAERQDRELTSTERVQLRQMLSESQNGPAVSWWADLGGQAIGDALAAYGITGFWMPPDEQWGDMAASANDVAKLVRLFIDGQSALRSPDREYVLSLMQSVADDQRWGVSAGVDFSGDADTVLAIKDGWYPQDGAWRVNSAGAITVGGQTDHVVVVLTDGADDFYRGVRAVEEVAAAVNASLYPPQLLVALPPFSRPEQAGPGDAVGVEPTPEAAPEATPGAPSSGPADSIEFVALRAADDVLVPAGAMLNSAASDESLAVWFEVPTAEVSQMMSAYVASMRALGWATISGPPAVVLSKPDQGRFVAVTQRSGGPADSEIIEFRVAPVPETTVGAATVH